MKIFCSQEHELIFGELSLYSSLEGHVILLLYGILLLLCIHDVP